MQWGGEYPFMLPVYFNSYAVKCDIQCRPVLQVEIECVVDKPALPRPSSRVDMLKSTDGRASPQSRSESPSSVTEYRKPNSDELVQVVGDGYQLITSVSSPHYY